jgi:hypothetical protein
VRSRAISCLSVAGVAGALAVPAAASAADSTSIVGGTVPTASAPLPAAEHVLLPIVHDRKAPYVRRDVRLAKRLAKIEGERLKRGYAKELRAWPIEDLERHAGVLRRAIARAKREAREERRRERAEERVTRLAAQAAPAAGTASAASTGGAANGTLEAIAQCESGGNPSAIGGGGQYRGKYQFSYSTWAAVGGSGDPAAASEAEQDARAAQLYATAGAGQWPVCGR